MNTDTKRIIKNTLALYIRQIFCTGISFFTVRVVLNTLGVEDYGVYNAVAGVVMLLSFLNGTMTSATQRFFSFALGRNDQEMLKCVFGTNLVIYLAIALAAVVLFETIGLWFVYNKLHLPPAKVAESRWLYQFAAAGFLASLVSSPYIAIIIAHEEMNLYAYVSVLDACLKLGVVEILSLLPFDKLSLYGALLCFESYIIAAFYMLFCSLKYPECRWSAFQFKRSMLKELSDFTGWTLFGCITTVFRYQAVTILINQFFNPAVVAARALAVNISDSLNTFTSNFNTGLYPPIIKAWSSGRKQEMYDLIYSGCRITFFLTWICALPCLLEMDFLLTVWLKNPPPDTVLFARLAVIEVIIFSLSFPLTTAARAPGKMMMYELTLGIMQTMIFPISWSIFTLGGQAYSTFAVAIAVNVLMFFVRVYMVHILVGLPIKDFSHKVLYPIGRSALPAILLLMPVKYYLPKGIGWSLLNFFSVLLLIGIISVFAGFSAGERALFFAMFRKNKSGA